MSCAGWASFPEEDPAGPGGQGGFPVLIAEDDLTARTMLAGILTRWGYSVQSVMDGRAALEALHQPDAARLAILDWIMPEMDGLEVIRQVRANPGEQPPYIILLTSKDDKGDILAGLEAGANDYIKKPFDHEELFARLRVGQRTVALQARLLEAQKRLAYEATHDPLTGLMNRRAILEEISRELSRMQREPDPSNRQVRIGYFDIDKYKTINDRYGHQVGDEVLQQLAALIRRRLRDYDSLGRIGGDEFVIVSPGFKDEHWENLFERITATITGTPLATSAGPVGISISMGVAVGTFGSNLEELLNQADTAMYRAKQQGGNRVAYAMTEQ